MGDSVKFYVKRNNYYAATFLSDLFSPKSAFEYSQKTFKNSSQFNSDYLNSLLEKVLNKNSSNISYNSKETERVLNQELEKVTANLEVLI